MPGRPTNEPANYAAIGKQTAKDTEATTFYFLRHLDGTGADLSEEVQSVREGGDGQEVGLRYKSAISLDGAMVANARPEVAARLFAWTLGADAVSVASGAATGMCQIHTAVPTSSMPYLTYEQSYADIIERVSNAQLTGLTIEGEAGAPMKLTANFVGGGTPYYPTAAQAPSRETGQPYFFPGGSYTIDGAGNTKITKFQADVQRNVDDQIRTTQLFREDVIALNFDTDLSFTLKYESATLYQKVNALGTMFIPPDALALATGSFQAYSQFAGPATATAGRFMEVNFPLITYTGAQVNKLDPDGKTMYLDISAMGIKNATYQIYTRVQTASAGAY